MDGVINFETTDGTATAPQDYIASSGQLPNPANVGAENQACIHVENDDVVEGVETFSVALTLPAGSPYVLDNGTKTQSIEFTILDDDDFVINSLAGVSIDENTTEVTTVTTNSDSGSVVFSITGGDDAALFSISEVGVLSFTSAPDFEAPGDVGGDNQYEVEVTAEHGGDSDSQVVTVNVMDVDEGAASTITTIITSGSTVINEGDGIVLARNSIRADGDFNSGKVCFSVESSAAEDVTVGFITEDGTATAIGHDYIPVLEIDGKKLLVVNGETPSSECLQIRDDPVVEGNETFSINFTILEGDAEFAGGSTSSSIAITIVDDDFLPVPDNDAFEVQEGATNLNVIDNDSPSSGVTASLGDPPTSPSWGVVTQSEDGNLIYTTSPLTEEDGSPAQEGSHIEDEFEYILTDTNGNNSESVGVVSLTINRAPIGNVDHYCLVFGEDSIEVGKDDGVLANDLDHDGDALEAKNLQAGGAVNGVLTLELNGSFVYEKDEDGMTRVTDSFTYDIDDDHGGTSTATIEIYLDNGSGCMGGTEL